MASEVVPHSCDSCRVFLSRLLGDLSVLAQNTGRSWVCFKILFNLFQGRMFSETNASSHNQSLSWDNLDSFINLTWDVAQCLTWTRVNPGLDSIIKTAPHFESQHSIGRGSQNCAFEASLDYRVNSSTASLSDMTEKQKKKRRYQRLVGSVNLPCLKSIL